MLLQNPYSIFPLGDSALTIDFGNKINEKINDKVLSLFKAFQQKPLPANNRSCSRLQLTEYLL